MEKSAGSSLKPPSERLAVQLVGVSYEKPTWLGSSMYSMLTSLFQLHGLSTVDLESSFTKQGPFSMSRPSMDEDPGPPLSQMARGAVSGFLRASKNQKKLQMA